MADQYMTGNLRPERLKQFGISSVDDLYDPVTNAKAALNILNSQGLNAWSVYKVEKDRILIIYLPQRMHMNH